MDPDLNDGDWNANMLSCEQLPVAVSEGMMTVTLRRPDKLNAITHEMREALRDAVYEFGGRQDLRLLLIRAEGRFFSAGMDIGAMGAAPESGIALRHGYRQLHEIFDEIERIEKPVVIAIQGPCLGGALEMALSCDFRLASTEAFFALPEVAIGVLPGSGGTSRLTQLVGKGWARWLVMANQRVSATQAEQIGLVQAVYPGEQFEAEVASFVASLLSLPAEVLGLGKVAIELSSELGRASARNVERVANTLLMSGDEHKRAVEAFRTRKSEK